MQLRTACLILLALTAFAAPPLPRSRLDARKTPACKYPNRQRKQLGLRIRFIYLRLTLGGVIFLNETLSMRLISAALILAGIGIVIREK